VHQSLREAGDDSVPAAVAPNAGERESEAPLGESESTMVGVTASAPIDARRCRVPPVGRTLPHRGCDIALFPSRSHSRSLLRPRFFSFSRLTLSLSVRRATVRYRELFPSRSFPHRVSFAPLRTHARYTYARRVLLFEPGPAEQPRANIIRGGLCVCVCVSVYVYMYIL